MKNAFSLVELSIVLVILGLLTGGILTGQTLIRAAELRSVTTEYQRYQAAVNTFRGKYFALPGDMRNATDFWGAADGDDGSGVDCGLLPSTDALTCNGDGDGRISATSVGFVYEHFRAWQHMANAGLIEGTYSGSRINVGSDIAVAGVNTPVSKQGPATWGFCDPSARQYGYGNALRLIHAQSFENASGECSLRNSAGISPDEAYSIDLKIDDGSPSTGKLLALGGADITLGWLNCITGPDGAPSTGADYDLTERGKNCLLQFVMQ